MRMVPRVGVGETGAGGAAGVVGVGVGTTALRGMTRSGDREAVSCDDTGSNASGAEVSDGDDGGGAITTGGGLGESADGKGRRGLAVGGATEPVSGARVSTGAGGDVGVTADLGTIATGGAVGDL